NTFGERPEVARHAAATRAGGRVSSNGVNATARLVAGIAPCGTLTRRFGCVVSAWSGGERPIDDLSRQRERCGRGGRGRVPDDEHAREGLEPEVVDHRAVGGDRLRADPRGSWQEVRRLEAGHVAPERGEE